MRRLAASLGAAALVAAACVSLWAADEPKNAPQPQNDIDFQELISKARSGSGREGPAPEKKYRDFAEVTKGAQKIDGLFTLHKKDEHLYAEIRPHQFDQPLLLPMTIARGLGQAGMPVGDNLVLVFHKAGDKVQVIRRNIAFKAPRDTPIEKSVKQNYTDSILMALPIVSVNPAGGMSTVIDLADIFFTDFAQLGLGSLDRNRTTWHKVKGFKDNIELEVEATFSGGRGGVSGIHGGGGSVADARGITLVLHYSLMKAPDPMYRPRLADDRIGHFLETQKDFGSTSPDSNYVRYLTRWRLEKADPRAKISPPKRRIVWWVEDTVPIEYRPYVEAGILEWNKAFEKIGIRNALEVRWQDGRDDFDPEDASYCTFRWVTSDAGFAMSCFRSNPMTGEIIDGDVVFDASFIRHWKQEYALMIGAAADKGEEATPVALGEVISPILAAKYGYGQLIPPTSRQADGPGGTSVEVIPADWSPLQLVLNKRISPNVSRTCQLRLGLRDDFGLAAMVLAAADKEKGSGSGELPEEFIGQALKEVVMHEVGHSLGLRHNFKASTMLTTDQLQDTTITSQKGLSGSVMDYLPVNIAPKGQKQGHYYSPTIGPYDYWAIEYAYKPIDGPEEVELKKIASRAPEPELVFATDEDAMLNNDPQVNRFDLGADPCQFAHDRIALASELMKDLDAKVVKDGESWARTRRAFGVLLNQYGNGAHLVSAYIGGQSIHRDHKGDKGAHDPIIPIPGAKQRECLKYLVDHILSDQAFQFSPALLRRLANEKWSGWGSEMMQGVEFPVLERILAIQKIALAQCLSPSVLARLQNQELQAEPGSDPLRMDEVFRALTDGIWSELSNPPAGDAKKPALSTIRRNLQREHLRRLSLMVLGQGRGNLGDSFPFLMIVGGSGASAIPADARALARLHLKEISDRIGKVLRSPDARLDDTSRAHLEECRQRITKVLDAPLPANEP
ncbi:MAG: zinc-dependent metalloprotease [Isosphaeraceae bacterium]|nr:zinc-dependent metalloprotease [Isosphaeraceae bacterium]